MEGSVDTGGIKCSPKSGLGRNWSDGRVSGVNGRYCDAVCKRVSAKLSAHIGTRGGALYTPRELLHIQWNMYNDAVSIYIDISIYLYISI